MLVVSSASVKSLSKVLSFLCDSQSLFTVLFFAAFIFFHIKLNVLHSNLT